MAEVYRLGPRDGFAGFVVPKACSGKAKCSAKAFFSLRKRLTLKLSVFQTVEDGSDGYRRLSKDHEYLPDSSEAMIRLTMVNLMVHRLKPG